MEQTNMPIGVKFAVIHRAFRREMDALLREKGVTGAQFGALSAAARSASAISRRSAAAPTRL